MANITIIGYGSWGTAIGQALSPFHQIKIWGRNANKIQELQKTHIHKDLGRITLNHNIKFTSNLKASLANSNYIFFAIPTQNCREVLGLLKEYIPHDIPLIQTAKGIEISTQKMVHEITFDIFPQNPIFLLSGPSFATDLVCQKPTAVSLAGYNYNIEIQNLFSNTALRVYANNDLMGVALGGALKNVLAVAAAFCMGYGLGESAKAALITRGFQEMVRFAEFFGANPDTLYGLSGLGDLILTANSTISRNYQYGLDLGASTSITSPTKTTEGYHTIIAIHKMRSLNKNDYPIFNALYDLIHNKKTKNEVVKELLERPFKQEFLC